MSNRTIHGWLWGALCWVVATQAGAGSVSVTLQLAEGLPFSHGQLAEALALRGVKVHTPGRGLTRVEVRARGAMALTVICDHKQQILELSSSDPRAVARLAALTISDLVRATMTVPLDLPPPRPPDDHKKDRVGAPRAAVGLLGRAGAGTNVDRPHFAVAVDGSVRVWGSLRGVLSVGVAFSLPVDEGQTHVNVTMLSLRGGLGWCPGALPALELRLGAVVRPLWLSGEAGTEALEHRDVLAGGALDLLYQIRLTRRLEGMAGAGVELYFNRMEFAVRGTPVLATERLAFWAGLGLRVRLL